MKTGAKKKRVGIVVSDKMEKTVAVRVERKILHPLVHKYVRRGKKYLAHDEKGECAVGDTVEIEETRPLSRRKMWRVTRIIRQGLARELGGAELKEETAV